MSADMLRDKKGFTLVEIIIVIAILGIFIMAMYSMFILELNTFSWSNQQYNVQSNIRLASNASTKEIRYATSLAIISLSDCEAEIASNKPNSYMYIKAGSLHSAIYDPSTSSHKLRTITGIYEPDSIFTKVSDDTIRITLAGKDGTKIYKLDADIFLRNFDIVSPKKLIVGTSGVAIRFSKTP